MQLAGSQAAPARWRGIFCAFAGPRTSRRRLRAAPEALETPTLAVEIVIGERARLRRRP